MMKVKQFNVCLLFAALAQQTLFAAAHANPAGAAVVNGQVSFSQPNAATLQITNSPGAIINWQDFNISAQEITRFVQESGSSAILNRVVGGNISEIQGQLQSNGKVFLINPNGLLIGQDAMINTAGFIGSTLNISDQDFLNGRMHFEGVNAADIDNQGYIRAGNNGDILLIAPNITNGGVLEVDGGNILLAAGQSITITSLDDADISFEVQAAANSVTNLGQIIANNGAANMFAGTLMHTGSVSANGITTDAAGNIRLVAKDTNWVEGDVIATGNQGGDIQLLGAQVGLDGNALIDASGTNGGGRVLIGGDYQGQGDIKTARASYVGENVKIKADALQNGDGGTVIVWGDESTKMYGDISARGGAFSGDGGFIETSGGYLDIGSFVPDAGAANGDGGTWLLDPHNIIIDAVTSVDPSGSGTLTDPFTGSTDDTIIDINFLQTALISGDVFIQTSTSSPTSQLGNITWNDGAVLDIIPIGNGKTLTLNAHNDVVINGQVGSQDPTGQNLNLTINADFDGDGQGSFTLGITGDLNLCPDLGSGCTVASILKVDAANGINMLGNVNTTTNPGSLISLHTDTGQINSSGILTTETLELSSTSAVNATINALSSSIANLSANMGAGSDINYRATSGINLSAINAVGGSLTIDTANSNLTQTGAIVTGTLDIVNAENVTLNSAANDIDNITASTSTFGGPLLFSFVDVDDLIVGNLTLTNGSTSAGSSTLNITSGGDMTLNGNINVADDPSDISIISGATFNALGVSNIIHQNGTIITDVINFQADGGATGAVGSALNPVQTAALNGSIEINHGGGDLFIRNTAGSLSLVNYTPQSPSILQIRNTATAADLNLFGVITVDSTGTSTPGELTAASIDLRADNGSLFLPIFQAPFKPGFGARLSSIIGDISLQGNNLSINLGGSLDAAGNIRLVSNLGALTIDDFVNSTAGSVELIADAFVINQAVTAQDQVIIREFNAGGLEVNDGTPSTTLATLTTAGLSLLTGTDNGILLGNNLTHTGTRSVVLVSDIDSSMINGPRLTIDTTNSTATGLSTARLNSNIDFTVDNEDLLISGNGLAEIGSGSIPANVVIDTGSGNFGSTASLLDIFGSAANEVVVRTNNAVINGDLFVSSGSLAGSSALFTGNNLTLQGALGIFADGANATVGFNNLVDINSPSFVDLSAGNLAGANARLLGGNINISASSVALFGGQAVNASAELLATGNIGISATGKDETDTFSVAIIGGGATNASASIRAGGSLGINAADNIVMQVGSAPDTDAYISAGNGLGTVVLSYANCLGCTSRIVLDPNGNGARDSGIRARILSRNGNVSSLRNLNPIPTLSALFQRFIAARLKRMIEDKKDKRKLLICT